jgi:hypothetical protein
MDWIAGIGLFAFGLLVFWVFYGIECTLNGASGGLDMPFREWVVEAKWNIPFWGRKFRVVYLRKQLRKDEITKEDHKMLPGFLHFLLVTTLPFVPFLGWISSHFGPVR